MTSLWYYGSNGERKTRKMIFMKTLLILLLLISINLTAQVGLGTLEPTASLEITTEPSGIPALRLVPQEDPMGSETGQMAVIGDKLFLFDAVRDKWLSVEKTIFEFGRLGSGSAPAEVEFAGGDLQNGPRLPFNATITGISLNATKDTNSRDVYLLINGVRLLNNDIDPSKDGVFNLNSSTLIYKNTMYNVDIKAGDMISFQVDNTVNDVENLIITLDIKWRKDNTN